MNRGYIICTQLKEEEENPQKKHHPQVIGDKSFISRKRKPFTPGMILPSVAR